MPTISAEPPSTELAPQEPISIDRERGTESRTESGNACTEEIARLAYIYWLEGGCGDGTAEEDWYRAERQLVTTSEEQTPALSAGRRVI